jgi:hypothetical protein
MRNIADQSKSGAENGLSADKSARSGFSGKTITWCCTAKSLWAGRYQSHGMGGRSADDSLCSCRPERIVAVVANPGQELLAALEEFGTGFVP